MQWLLKGERQMETTFDLDALSHDQLLTLSESLLNRLSAVDLTWIRDLAEEIRQQKLEAVKNEVMAEIKAMLEQRGLSFDEVMAGVSGRNTRRNRDSQL